MDRNDRRVVALVSHAAERGSRITVPATALAQAMRNPARQSRLSRLIRQAGTDLIVLDGRAGQAVITSDPDDLRRIAPGLTLLVV